MMVMVIGDGNFHLVSGGGVKPWSCDSDILSIAPSMAVDLSFFRLLPLYYPFTSNSLSNKIGISSYTSHFVTHHSSLFFPFIFVSVTASRSDIPFLSTFVISLLFLTNYTSNIPRPQGFHTDSRSVTAIKTRTEACIIFLWYK